MIRKILVPLDGSALAEQALPPALALAQPAPGQIILLRVPVQETMLLPVPEGYGVLWPDQSLDYSRSESREYLERMVQAQAGPGVTLRAQLVDGDVAGSIVDTAQADEVDLIVMSTHGYSGVTRWVLGSVTEKVLRQAHCPVLVTRSTAPIERTLIPLDGSRLSEQALDVGLEVAAGLRSAVTLLRVVPPVSAAEVEYFERIELGLGQRLLEDSMASADSYLRDLAAAAALPGQDVASAVQVGSPAEAILKFAETQGSNLIVMATHGRTGLRRWAYGSVTEKVMRGTQGAAMLIVRPADQHMN